MNKKRKILTLAALAVFGAIIVFHYGSISYDDVGHESIEYMTAAQKAAAIKLGQKVTPKPLTAEETATASLFAGIDVSDLPEDTGPPKERVIVKYPGQGLYVTDYRVIEDVRMPLFALTVFYAGLFSLLGDKKRDPQ